MNRFTSEEKDMICGCVNACLDASLDIVDSYNNGRGHTRECARNALHNALMLSDILDKLEE